MKATPRRYFLIGFTILLTMCFGASYFLGNAFESILQPIDCETEIEENPDGFKPLDGTIDEKLKQCEKWNEMVDSTQYVPLMTRIMLVVPVILFVIHINMSIGLRNILKNDFGDLEL